MEEHGNRIFEIKETVICKCQKCNKEYKNPSVSYYVKDINMEVCS